ncbi:MAG TPA: allantoicase [Longimicrobium sp.]
MTPFQDLVDLASERLGGAVLLANDEFFAPKEALLKPGAPEWREHEYTERGKWMDGWETRRRRDPGHDWCIIRLGLPGVVCGLVVDTAFFRGNFPESCSVEGCDVSGVPDPEQIADDANWFELLPQSLLQGNAENLFPVNVDRRVTHLRLNIFPDGGVARLRVHGWSHPTWTRFALQGGEVDLAALENGGWVPACSDMFYGHRQNLILPGRSRFMGDGWETRRRGPGHHWSILRLGAPGAIHRIELDTDFFMGNAPVSVALEGIHSPGGNVYELTAEGAEWMPLLDEIRLQPHTRHRWQDEVRPIGPITHARLKIFPDGGVARLRLWGTLATPSAP